ncbi:MAG: hypothetical protein ACREO5_06300 [Candidatus Binatia bacterium]
MIRQTRPDPFVVEVFGRNPETIKPWVKAEPSSHIWTARLPASLKPGAHATTCTPSMNMAVTVMTV